MVVTGAAARTCGRMNTQTTLGERTTQPPHDLCPSPHTRDDTAPSASPPRDGAAEQALDALEAHYAPGPRWRDARFLWLKTVPAVHRGRVGEALFSRLFEQAGIEVGPGTAGGHADRRAAGLDVEVKLSTLYDLRDGGLSYYKWMQLRPSSTFDVVAFLAVDPGRVRMWLVDKDTAIAHAKGQHTGKDAVETRELTVGEDDVPAWMGPDVAGDAAALLSRLVELGGDPSAGALS